MPAWAGAAAKHRCPVERRVSALSRAGSGLQRLAAHSSTGMRREIRLLAAAAAWRWLAAAACCSPSPAPGGCWYGSMATKGLQRPEEGGRRVRAEDRRAGGGARRAPDRVPAAAAAKGAGLFCWPHDRVGEFAVRPDQPLTPRQLRDEIEELAWKAFTFAARPGLPDLDRGQRTEQGPAEDAAGRLRRGDAGPQAEGRRRAILWTYNQSFFTWPTSWPPTAASSFKLKPDGTCLTRSTRASTNGAVKGGGAAQR